MRILMLIHRLDDASPYCFYVHEQARALTALGHEVTVISPVALPPLARYTRPSLAAMDARTPQETVYDGVRVFFPRCLTLGNPGERVFGGRFMAGAALPIARRLHQENPFDVVHAHMLPVDGHAGQIIAKALGLPLVITVHGTDVLHYFIPGKTPWKRNVRLAGEANALIAVSTMLLQRVAPYRQAGISKVVQNGVDLSLVPQGGEKRPRSVLSVGTLKARKCMDRTLEAFAKLADDYKDATLTIVGVGPMEAQLRERIRELGLQDRARLTGGLPHEEVLRLMGESDVFVLPSWGEGYGVVYIEAMAAGMIAIGAENEGIADTITDGENGFLVPAGDTDAVERTLRRIFADEAKWDGLRMRGQRDARALTWERNAKTMEEIYREIILHHKD